MTMFKYLRFCILLVVLVAIFKVEARRRVPEDRQDEPEPSKTNGTTATDSKKAETTVTVAPEPEGCEGDVTPSEPSEDGYLVIFENEQRAVLCSGSLITVKEVLTAGSCAEKLFEELDNIKKKNTSESVWARFNLRHTSYDDKSAEKQFKVKVTGATPMKYYVGSFENFDLGIVTIERSNNANNWKGYKIDATVEVAKENGITLTMLTWGETNKADIRFKNRNMTVVDREHCVRQYGKSHLKNTHIFFCLKPADGEKGSACEENSGAPILSSKKDLVAITLGDVNCRNLSQYVVAQRIDSRVENLLLESNVSFVKFDSKTNLPGTEVKTG